MHKNILHWKDPALEKLYREISYHDRRLPNNLRRSYFKACYYLEHTPSIKSLASIRGLNFERYQDHYSIRINKGWRIEFDYDHQ